VDGGILWHLGADVLQLGFLLIARDRDAPPLPGRDALLQGDVVERAACPQHALKFPLLDWRGLEFVLVGFAYRLLFPIHSLFIHSAC